MVEKQHRLKQYFIYFMMYAILGWCYEVFLEVVVYGWGFTNRGVLTGPYCPIYGVGAMVFLLCFGKLLKKQGSPAFRAGRVFLIFAGSMALATLIELGASYLLEVAIGSWPWQTYINYSINFQGRVALSPSIRFGLGGLLFLYLLQPCFEKIVGRLSAKGLSICFYTLATVFLVDLVFTLFRFWG